MTYTPAALGFLVGGMLFTGTINTLLNKLQDLTCVENCDAPVESDKKRFEQPLFQTLNMFFGESCCLLVFYANLLWAARKNAGIAIEDDDSAIAGGDHEDDAIPTPTLARPGLPMTGWKNLLLWIPTLCDLTATTLMNVGLIYISASIYQMLRGSVVIFTGILSTFFLRIKHPRYRWFALGSVFLGVLLVGLAGIVEAGATSSVPVQGSPLGLGMVVLAQVFTAFQFVIEERLMAKYSVPAMKAVGLEGLFGLISVGVALPILHFTYGVHGPPGNFANVVTGFHEVIDHPQVWMSGIGIIFSIAFFNWFGLTVTRNISATSRSTIDTCRTLFIWIVSLGLGWETFKYLQVVGFVVLIYGTFLFNNVVTPPQWNWLKDGKEATAPHSEPLFVGAGDDEERPLLADVSVPSER